MLATATVAKAQPMMRRQRPSISTRNTLRAGTADEEDVGSAYPEPFVRTASYILKKFKGRRPSLIVHLYPTFFRFDQQEGTFSYKSEMRIVIEHLSKQTIPHELVDEFLRSGIQFYDGCLIVEVRNHRAKDAKLQKKAEGPDVAGSTVPFSMHNYNEHVTPSPYVPFPTRDIEGANKKIKTLPEAGAALDTEQQDRQAMPAPAPASKNKDDAHHFTTVLFPTDLSRHHEILFLASTPAVDARGRKNSRDGAVPSTPTMSQGKNKPTKMLLEDKDVYDFEAAYLLVTEGPLLLAPVKSPGGVAKVLATLEHPLHCDSAPTGRSRKRTQADVAADDAQAAREEQKMLIMDERVKPSIGATAGGDGQTSTSSLGFTRLKTLEAIKRRHEEKERQRKEEEARTAMERRQQEMVQAQKRKTLEEQKRNAMDAQQQQQQQQMLLRHQMQQQQVQQKRQLQQQINAMAQTQQQQVLQQQAAVINHSSPIVRNQTPMMNSSPMTANANLMQNGFPMQATASSQGAGSPARPPSALHHPSVGMARQVSQQQHMTRHNTPQMPGATPMMVNAQLMDATRQMSATPRLANHGSPAQNMQGTPNGGVNMMMNVNGPHMNGTNLTPQQMMILQQQQQQRRMMQQQQMQQMSPEQIAVQQQRLQANQGSMNPQVYQQQVNRLQQMQLAHAQARQQQQQQNAQMNGNAEAMARAVSQQAGGQQAQQQQQSAGNSGGGGAADITIAQRQNAVLAARHRTAAMNQSMMHMQQELSNAAQRHGGQVPPQLRAQILQQHQQRVAMQHQQFAQRAQQSAAQTVGTLGDVDNTEQYMRNLRGQQAMLARMTGQAAMSQGQGQQIQGQASLLGGTQNGMGTTQQQQQQQGMGRGQLSLAQMQALRAAQQQQQQQQQQNGGNGGQAQSGDVLAQQFQAMQNALNRPG